MHPQSVLIICAVSLLAPPSLAWPSLSNDKLSELVRGYKKVLATNQGTQQSGYPPANVANGGNANLKDLLGHPAKGLDQDPVVKAKLFQMLTDSKREIDEKYGVADKVHSYLKINHRYTLGFTVGLLKAQQELLARVYADARRHFYDWDNLKILGAYEQIRKTERQLDELISTLTNAVARQPLLSTATEKFLTKTINAEKRIAWDYYDES